MPQMPPVPYQTPVTDDRGLTTQPWAKWFELLRALVMSSSSSVSSVFGRTGAVVAASGDYNSDQVTEGATNLYFTSARFNTAFAAKSTTNLTEGTNLYFTNARAQSAMSGLYEVPLTFSTGLTRSTNTITVNTSQNIAKLTNMTSNGFVKTSGGDGTLSIDTSTYLTGNQTITLSGDVTGSGTTSISTTVGKINGTSLAGLATGILKNTTGTGVPSIAVAADFPTLNQNTTGTAANVTGTVAISNGGTGQTAKTAAFDALSPNSTKGDLTYHDGTNNVRMAGNTTTTKKFLTQTGDGTNSAAPSWGTIAAADVPTLNQNTTGTASNVTGTVAIANGGTGQTAKTAAFDALSPLTTSGDIIYHNGTNNVRLAKGSDGQVLTLASGAPSWAAATGSSLPSGMMSPYAGSSAPSGWLLCDGSAVSRTTYSALFTAIGTSFGSGDGSTTFNLPDTRNVFLRGVNASTRTIGGISYPAVTLGTTTNDKMQGHFHEWKTPLNASGSNWAYAAGNSPQFSTSPQIGSPITDGTNGTPRTGSETAPVNLGVNFIIKT